MTTQRCPSSSCWAILTAAATAEPELPPAAKHTKYQVHIRGCYKPPQLTVWTGQYCKLTTQKTLLSDQLAWHGERLHIGWLIPHVDKLCRLVREVVSSKHMIIALYAIHTRSHMFKYTHRSVQNCRDEVVSNALHFKWNLLFILLFWFNQNGSLRVHTNYLKTNKSVLRPETLQYKD